MKSFLVLSLIGMISNPAYSNELVRLVIQGGATQELAIYDEETESLVLNCSRELVATHPQSTGGKVVHECFFEAERVRIETLNAGEVQVEFAGEAVATIEDYLARYGSERIQCDSKSDTCSMIVETAEVVSLNPRVHPSVTVTN